MSSVTRFCPAVSFDRLAGAVASSAISTHRSRSRPMSIASSSLPALALGPCHAENRLRLVDRAVRRRERAVLAHPSAEEQPGRPVVALAGVDLHRRPEPRARRRSLESERASGRLGRPR